MAQNRPTMDTGITANPVTPSAGVGNVSGTPGKAAGVYSSGTFVMQGIDSSDNLQDAPKLPQYWNVNGTSENTVVKNNEP